MRTVTLFLVLLAPTSALAWGFDGHRRLARHLGDALPAGCLREWIAAQQSAAFQDASADPDRWRIEGSPGFDPLEWPRHYLEIDRANPVSSYPRDFAAVKELFGRYAEKNGQVPWRAAEYQEKLAAAFRARDGALARTTLAHLSHYVTDAFSVLHDTQNFDPNGLHLRWESDLLQSSARVEAIAVAMAGHLGTVGRSDTVNHLFDVIRVGNGLVAELIAVDQAAVTAGSPDLEKLFLGAKDLTARRWADAITLMGSIVATAWVDAGSPRLTGMAAACSATLPQGPTELRGYPVPGGWTTWQPPSAPDAGEVPVGTGGTGGGEVPPVTTGPGDGQPPEAKSPSSCGGLGVLGLPQLALAAAAVQRGRRRRR